MPVVSRINKHLKEIMNILEDQYEYGGMFKASREIQGPRGRLMIHMKGLGDLVDRWDRVFLTEEGIKDHGWDSDLISEMRVQGSTESADLMEIPLIEKALYGKGSDEEQTTTEGEEEGKDIGLMGQHEANNDPEEDSDRGQIFSRLIMLSRQITIVLQLADALADLTRTQHEIMHNPILRTEERNMMEIFIKKVPEYLMNQDIWGEGYESKYVPPGFEDSGLDSDDSEDIEQQPI